MAHAPGPRRDAARGGIGREEGADPAAEARRHHRAAAAGLDPDRRHGLRPGAREVLLCASRSGLTARTSTTSSSSWRSSGARRSSHRASSGRSSRLPRPQRSRRRHPSATRTKQPPEVSGGCFHVELRPRLAARRSSHLIRGPGLRDELRGDVGGDGMAAAMLSCAGTKSSWILPRSLRIAAW